MKTIFALQKYSVLLAIALLAGILLMTETFYDFYDHVLSEGIKASKYSWGLLVGQSIYFVLLAWLLLIVNINRKIHYLRQFFISALIAGLFALVAFMGVPTFQHTANDKIYNEVVQSGLLEQQEKNVEEKSSYRKRKPYYFHEPNEAWASKTLSLFLVIYILSQLYIVVMRKQDIERDYEALKNESLQSKLSALNNQINPHFFFNALNSLHALINEEKKECSLQYVESLSNVFRYILQSDKHKVVTLQDELNFLSTYRDMLSVKYDKKLRFDIDIKSDVLFLYVPVLSLLPLVENIIKHNEISSRNPMLVRLYTNDDNALVVENPKHEKLDAVDSVGIGLKNLSKRFQLLLSKDIHVEDNGDVFRVILPLGKNTASDNVK